jgi:putative DNA primase/helicase
VNDPDIVEGEHPLSATVIRPVRFSKHPPLAQHGYRTRGPDITQASAALDFVRRYNGKLLFDHDAGAWFHWTGKIWEKETTGLALEYAIQLCGELAEIADGPARVALGRASFAASVEAMARVNRVFAMKSTEWDKDDFILGTPGGTVDLRTGKLRAAKPDDHLTKMTAVEPAKSADCPIFLKFLDEATGGDVELIRFLQQFCGYSLTGDISEHALGFICGPGGNGKSVFVNTIAGILRDYADVAPMDALMASSNSRHETELADMRGARLVTASETEAGKAWAEARIKTLTGGEMIKARFMRQNYFKFLPKFKLLISGNHRPVLRNADEAMEDACDVDVGSRLMIGPSAKLFESWKGYATLGGSDPGSQVMFSQSMEARGFQKYRVGSGMVFCGVRLKQAEAA